MDKYNDDILIDPETGKEYINVPVKVAAKYLDFPVPAMYECLKQGKAPFGIGVVPTSGSKWSFVIPIDRLKAWAHPKRE